MWVTGYELSTRVDVYGDSLVLLVQRSNFQTPKRLEAGADLFKTGVIGHGHLKFTASSKLEVNYPATSIKGMIGDLEEYLKTPKRQHSLGWVFQWLVYGFFSVLSSKIPSRNTVSSSPVLVLFNVDKQRCVYKISAEQVIRKNVFHIFLFQKNRFTRHTSVEGMLLWNLLN